MTDRPLPGIETIRVRPHLISGRGVILAMKSRERKIKIWGWLIEWFLTDVPNSPRSKEERE